MTKIKIENNRLFIEDTLITEGKTLSDFEKILGTANKDGEWLAKWDKTGITIFFQEKKWIRIEVYYSFEREDWNKFPPAKDFTGEFLINGEEVFRYKNSHKNLLVRRKNDSDKNALAFENLSLKFIEDDSDKMIRIEKFDGQLFENPAFEHFEHLKEKTERSDYEKAWINWLDEILKSVPKDNQYFNLKECVSKDEIKENKKLSKKVSIPEDLIEFYKVFDVDYNAVTSALSFEFQGVDYDLLPFENIAEHWEGIQDLNEADEVDKSGFSDKVNCDDYANPQWIPFAEDRQGSYLLYDNDPSPSGKKGQIIELVNETWERNVVADSLQELIEKETKNWKKAKTELLDFILKN